MVGTQNRANTRTRTAGRVGLAALVLVAVAGLTGVAENPVTAQAASGPYSGSAFVDLVHLDALNIPGTVQVVDLSVAPALAEATSSPIVGGGGGPIHATSRATNLDLEILSGTLPLTGLVVEAAQTAPPDNAEPTVNELLHLPVNPLLDVLLARASAHSRWAGDQCVPPGTPISQAQSEVADVQLITGAGGPAGTALVALDNRQGSTVFTRSTVGLADVAGSANKAVIAEAHTQLTALTLFKGTPNELTVNVIAPPVVTAIATGQPGGATVTYSEPILQIVQNGTVVGELNAADINQTITVPGGILELKLGTLESTTAPDGTSAEGSATLLSVTLLGPPLPIEVIAPFSIAAGTVSAHVPVGGVVCGGPPPPDGDNPLREVHKDASTANVQAGGTFTYTVAVPNRGTCQLTAVKVVDTVTGPAGTTIESAVPAASTTEGLKLTWNDIGPIAPNETKTLVITVKVPSGVPNGTIYRNDVVVSAMCDGRAVEQPANIVAPEVFTPASGGCRVSDSNKAESHREVMVGETFNYYIHVFNSGDSPCSGVSVKDTLIEDVEFVSCSDSCTQSGKDVSWSLGTLAGGSSRTLVLTVKVAASATAGERLPDAADISTTASDNQPARTARVQTPGPLVSGNSVLAGPNLPRGSGELGETGPPATAAFGTLAVAAWYLARRYRRALTA